MKNGSYWRTGLPLLLKIVQPLPTQRGLTSFGVISGWPSAPTMICRRRRAGAPVPARPGSSSGSRGRSRRSRRSCAGSSVCSPAARSATWVSRARVETTAGCGSGWSLRALVGEQVVDQPRGGAAAGWRAGRPAGWPGASSDDGLGQVGVEAVQRVALGCRRRGLPITAVPTTMPERVEGHCGAVAVGVRHQPGCSTR